MTKIALTAAAVLIATGTAFAGSDHYGSKNPTQPSANIDSSFTASIQKSNSTVEKPITFGSDRNLFGNH